MEGEKSPLTLAVRFKDLPDNYPASGAELDLIASFLPERLKEMLTQSDTDGE